MGAAIGIEVGEQIVDRLDAILVGLGMARADFSESRFVIASQRVRPEVAGPMTGSAKQSRVFRKWLWIASPFGLAMTKVRIYGDEEIKPRAVTTIH